MESCKNQGMAYAVHIVATPTDWWTVSAAWAQALGTVGAIAAAIWISRSEQRKQAVIRRQERVAQISLIQGAANDACSHIEQVAAMIGAEHAFLEYRSIDESRSRNLAALLSRIEVEKLRSPTGAAAVIGLAADVEAAPAFANAAGELMHEQGAALPTMGDDVEEWVARARASRDEIMRMTPEF